MPFVSEKQRRFMYARHPEIAKRWSEEEKQGNPVAKKRDTKKSVLSYYAGALKRRGIKPPTEEEKRKRERARVEAHMRGGLQQRATARKPPTPLTPAQIRSKKAEALRERIMPKTGLETLTEVLTPKKKKED